MLLLQPLQDAPGLLVVDDRLDVDDVRVDVDRDRRLRLVDLLLFIALLLLPILLRITGRPGVLLFLISRFPPGLGVDPLIDSNSGSSAARNS